MKKYLELYQQCIEAGVEAAEAATMACHAVSQQAIFSAEDVAAYIGCSRDMSDKMLNDGTIPTFKVGCRKFALKEKVTEWASRACHSGHSPLPKPARPVC